MINFTTTQKLRHLIIKSGWRKWIPLALSGIPYILSIFWLLGKGQAWIANVMLAPILMTGLLVLLTVILARLEFRR